MASGTIPIGQGPLEGPRRDQIFSALACRQSMVARLTFQTPYSKQPLDFLEDQIHSRMLQSNRALPAWSFSGGWLHECTFIHSRPAWLRGQWDSPFPPTMQQGRKDHSAAHTILQCLPDEVLDHVRTTTPRHWHCGKSASSCRGCFSSHFRDCLGTAW